MARLDKTTFVCVDCEFTGLDVVEDRIVEIAIAKFTMSEVLQTFETLINPEKEISEVSIAIHKITPDMVQDKPRMGDVMHEILSMIDRHIAVGHGISHDLEMIANAADRIGIPHDLRNQRKLDTLRLARLYGESPINSLEQLRIHFHIPLEGAHRAMSDVIVNIEVFKRLTQRYTTTDQLFDELSKPIRLKNMPLGKHKGRPIKELPLEYLLWAAKKEFDQDLLFSLRSEINRRKKGNSFGQSVSPFADL